MNIELYSTVSGNVHSSMRLHFSLQFVKSRMRPNPSMSISRGSIDKRSKMTNLGNIFGMRVLGQRNWRANMDTWMNMRNGMGYELDHDRAVLNEP